MIDVRRGHRGEHTNQAWLLTYPRRSSMGENRVRLTSNVS